MSFFFQYRAALLATIKYIIATLSAKILYIIRLLKILAKTVLLSYCSGSSLCGRRHFREGGAGGGDTAQHHQTRLWAACPSSTYGAALHTKGWWESSRYVTLKVFKSFILCKCHYLFSFFSCDFPQMSLQRCTKRSETLVTSPSGLARRRPSWESCQVGGSY